MGGGNGPFWTAVELGLFAEEGVDLSVKQIKGGMAKVAEALVAGETHIATMGAPSLVRARLDGADLVCIIGLVNKLLFQIMTVPEITTVNALRGRTLATSRGSTDAVLWQWFLPQHDLRPGVDVNLREIPDTDDQIEALRRREIDGMTLSPASSTYLRKDGFNELVDFDKHNVDFQLGCVVTSRQLIETHPQETRAYVAAHVAAIRRYKQDRPLGLRVLQRYTGIEDQEILVHSYEMYVRNFLDWPYPSVKGLETVIETIAQLDPRASGLRPAEVCELRFLDMLREEEGT
jgi:ABC-type nitrate/sulfonate/bicarbonate transport system substrate-binding protein